MANSDKNILITPSTGSSTANPTIKFTGANNTPLTLRVLDDGTVSFEGTAGQLFSVSDGLSGSIFSVNDISGIPSIEVLDTGAIKIAQYGGQVGIGAAPTTAMTYILNNTAANTGLLVSGPSGQTGDYLNVKNYGGTSLFHVGSDGYTEVIGQRINVGSAGVVGLTIKGMASGTDDLQQWQNNAGTPLVRIDSSGNFSAASITGKTMLTIYDAVSPIVQWYNTGAGTDIKYWRAITTTGGDWQLQSVNDAYNTATTRLSVLYTGNVGIGTASPASRLTLQSATNTSFIKQIQSAAQADINPYTVGGIQLQDVLRDAAISNPAAYINFVNKNTNSGWPTTIRGVDITFGTADGANGQGTTASERMRIDASGNVGIGRTPASEKLEVAGAVYVSGATTSNQTGAATFDYNGSQARIVSWGADGSTSGTVTFWTGNGGAGTTEKVRIGSSGNLNVNTTSNTLGNNGTANAGTHTFAVASTGTANIVGVIRGTASQTADLTQWQNSSGSVLSYITSAGQLITPAINANILATGSVKVGHQALNALTGSGSYNVGIGFQAGQALTSGIENVAIGQAALQSNSTGYDNTVVGTGALYKSTASSNNTVIGAWAVSAVASASVGNNNTVVGYSAAASISGAQNTVFGASAGSSLTTGSNNIVIGYTAAASAATVSNEITLGNASITSFRIPGLSISASTTAITAPSFVATGEIKAINFTPSVNTTTTALDFATEGFKTISIAANTTFTASNYAAGRTVTVKVTCDATQRTLTFPTSWVFVGTKPANIAASKIGILTVTSFGTTEAECVAAWAVQA